LSFVQPAGLLAGLPGGAGVRLLDDFEAHCPESCMPLPNVRTTLQALVRKPDPRIQAQPMRTVAGMRGWRRSLAALALGLAGAAGAACAAPDRSQPLLALVSFDGWRSDYLDRGRAPNLQALAARGIRADGLVPVFPSKTFPNHYTIVTGLFPDHHGITSNVIVDPGFPDRFTMQSATAKEARWWGGEPLWVTAERQGRRAATMFWPGSEAPIGGVRPTYWKPFDDGLPSADRVRQVLDWLALPAGEQPALVTLYFSDVDTAGHRFGPDSPEVSDAVQLLDDMLGRLLAGIERLGLADRLDLVVVSDHGMSPLDADRVILLDDYLDLSTVDVIEMSPVLQLRPRSPAPSALDDAYRALKDRHPALAVYRREEVPEHLHYRDSARIQPIVGLADDGWEIMTRAEYAGQQASGAPPGGGHGYDPRHRSMQGLFVAAGPRIREGLRVPAFDNVHLYDFLCRLLDLVPADNDGDARVTAEFLKP
jgi:predicted AlkP superfamily pyrophosphatase or phosphodiesterase